MPQMFYAMNTTVKLINLNFKHKKNPSKLWFKTRNQMIQADLVDQCQDEVK